MIGFLLHLKSPAVPRLFYPTALNVEIRDGHYVCQRHSGDLALDMNVTGATFAWTLQEYIATETAVSTAKSEAFKLHGLSTGDTLRILNCNQILMPI
jgi:hypothetical protein